MAQACPPNSFSVCLSFTHYKLQYSCWLFVFFRDLLLYLFFLKLSCIPVRMTLSIFGVGCYLGWTKTYLRYEHITNTTGSWKFLEGNGMWYNGWGWGMGAAYDSEEKAAGSIHSGFLLFILSEIYCCCLWDAPLRSETSLFSFNWGQHQ